MGTITQTEAYDLFKNELFNKLLGSDIKDQNALSKKTLDSLIKKCKSITGVEFTLGVKPVRNYMRGKEYSVKYTYIGLFAAALLIEKKLLSQQDCIKHHKENLTSSYYWHEYFKSAEQVVYPEELAEVSDSEKYQIESNNIPTIDQICITPELEQVVVRTKQLEELENLAKRSRVVIIDGVLGSGKTSLVRALHERLILSKSYNSIFWKPSEKNYTLQLLISEIEEVMPLGPGSVHTKALKFVNFLKENHCLLILDDCEEITDEAFFHFLKSVSNSIGITLIIVIGNSNAGNGSIRSSCIFKLEGFDVEQISLLLDYYSISISKNEIKALHDITDGLPFYIDIFAQAYLTSQGESQPILETLLNSSDTKNWIKFLCSKLSSEEIIFLKALSKLNRPITAKIFKEVGDLVNIPDSNLTLEKFKSYRIFKGNDNESWRIMPLITSYLNNTLTLKEKEELNELIGNYILGSLKIERYNFSKIENVIAASNGVRHFQEGGNYYKSNQLLQMIINHLKRFNLNLLLRQLVLVEMSENASYSYWLGYHYSHSCILTGDWMEFERAIKITVHKAINLYKGNRENPDIKSFFIKSLQLYASYIGLFLSYDEALKILITTLSIFEPFDLEWSVKSHSTSLLSNFYLKCGELNLAHKINENLLNEVYSGNAQSKAIAYTRLGLVKIEKKQLDLAFQDFEKAHSLFSEFNDMRGISWSLSYKVYCSHKLKRNEDLNESIKSVVELNQDSGYFDKEYIEWLGYFKKTLKDEIFRKMAEKEFVKLNEKYKNILDRIDKKLIQDECDTICLELKNFINTPIPIEYYISPISDRVLPLNSEFSKTALIKIRKDPLPVIENIFKKKPEQIFSESQSNAIILSSLNYYLFRDKVFQNYVLPNTEIIKMQSHEVIINYARVLEYIGERSIAFDLLSQIPEGSWNFSYYDINGNYYRKEKSFDKSYENYQTALSITANNKEKAIAYFNIAQLIFEFEHIEKYPEAKDNCLKAISLRQSDLYFLKFAVNTLFFLELELCPNEKAEAIALDLKKNYVISDARFKWLILDTRNVFKRKILIDLINKKK